MNRLKPADAQSVRDYFSTELSSVLSKHKVAAENGTFDYLVELLTHYLATENFFETTKGGKFGNNYLVDLYVRYLQAGPEEKKTILKRLGDICLLVSGYFAASLTRKMVDIEYYFGMGGTAYHTLAQMQFNDLIKGLFSELSQKFQPFSNVLGELSERSGVQSNSDLLRLYERWLATGSETLREKLSHHGIASPARVNNKTPQ
ncbi:MAG: hypothetical protein HYZ71_12190 [Deltaproteobacteria bacterium]|nr:hypothetical protein [Deltaproteobacteria bacterium]